MTSLVTNHARRQNNIGRKPKIVLDRPKGIIHKCTFVTERRPADELVALSHYLYVFSILKTTRRALKRYWADPFCLQ